MNALQKLHSWVNWNLVKSSLKRSIVDESKFIRLLWTCSHFGLSPFWPYPVSSALTTRLHCQCQHNIEMVDSRWSLTLRHQKGIKLIPFWWRRVKLHLTNKRQTETTDMSVLPSCSLCSFVGARESCKWTLLELIFIYLDQDFGIKVRRWNRNLWPVQR